MQERYDAKKLADGEESGNGKCAVNQHSKNTILRKLRWNDKYIVVH